MGSSVIPASNVEGSGLDIGPSVILGIIVEGSGVWHRTIHDIGLQRGMFGLEGWDHP